ncbi:MAG: hypothetical protein HOI15_05925 [Opitutales bacterium]|nr:hypothetical protein [Opitutales bacterium]
MKTLKTNYRIRLLATASAMTSFFFIGCSSESQQRASDDNGHSHEDAHDHEGEVDHDNDHEKKEGGPSGGRIITSVNPRVEFLINDDRSIQLTFLDNQSQPIAPNSQVISLISGDRSNPTMIAFTPKDNALVSTQALPEGNSVPVVLQIKESPTAEIIREKFNANLSECPTCDYQEYACVCGHDD